MAFPVVIAPQVAAGEVRVLATAGEERIYHDMPTLAEIRVAGDVGFMHRVFLAPAGTPEDVPGAGIWRSALAAALVDRWPHRVAEIAPAQQRRRSMKVKEKPIWTFKVTGRQETATRSVVRARDVAMVIDEPIERGGTNLGPMPVETMIMGFVGCTHVISNKLARANGVEITSMDIEVTTKMDSHGTRLLKPVDVPFPEVKIVITAEMTGPDEGIVTVVDKLKEHCAVATMLRAAGTAVTESWIVNGTERAGAA